MASSLRTLTLLQLGISWDRDPFWLRLTALTNITALEVEFMAPSAYNPLPMANTDARQRLRDPDTPFTPLPALDVAKIRGMRMTTWRALGVVRNATHVLLHQCQVTGDDLEGLVPNAASMANVEGSSSDTPGQHKAPVAYVNSRLQVLAVKLLTEYAPTMWRHLARCTMLKKLSVWCPSTLGTSDMQVCL